MGCNGCYVVHLPLLVVGRAMGITKPVPWRRQPNSIEEEGGSVSEAAAVGLLIAPLWFAAQWTYSQGVDWTSATASTVISTTSCMWTLMASVIFLREQLTCAKVAGVALCMAGNVVQIFSASREEGKWLGDILCLASAIIYAVYTTILKKLLHPETSVMLLFGTLGLVVLVFGTPLVLWLAMDELLGMSSTVFGLLIFNGLFDNVLSQYAWAKAVQWTSPTAATVGLSLTIPMTIVTDVVRRNPLYVWDFIAAVCVIAGFLSIALSPEKGSEVKPSELLTNEHEEVVDGTPQY